MPLKAQNGGSVPFAFRPAFSCGTVVTCPCFSLLRVDPVYLMSSCGFVATPACKRMGAELVFFTSDTHFGDRRTLNIDRRPFATLQEHDEALIALWNDTVGAGEDVWHLGDFARGSRNVDTLLSCLHGRKHLVIGNNDDPDSVASKGWSSVQHYAELSVEGRLLVLCHYPFRTWNQMGRGSVNLHGHSHGRLKPLTRQFDVGVDSWRYRPVPLAVLLERRRHG